MALRNRVRPWSLGGTLLLIVGVSLLACGCDDSHLTEPAGASDPSPPSKPGLEDQRAAAATSTWHASGADAYDSQVPLAWFDLAYRLVQAERWSPPVASRAFGYAGVSLYEALVPGMRGSQSLAGQLNGLVEVPPARGAAYHWPTVANAALAATLRGLFGSGTPATLARIDVKEEEISALFEALLPAGILARSVAQGEAVAEAILDWAAADGYAVLHNCVYTPPAGAGLWEPTPPAFAPALEPCWGQLRPFVLTRASSCDPGPPPVYSETAGSPFLAEAREVYETSLHATPEQITIANYWADGPGQTGTPPGHSIAIASQILATQGHSLDVAAETYAKVGIAVADAFIACWWSKYEYNLLRPVSCIRRLTDVNWNSLIATPPFPEYTSGHSVQSGAAAQVMTDLFGAIPFTDHTHDARGLQPRSFDDFFDAAEEAAISRLYGGIHFRSAIVRGIEQGRCVGQQVSALRLRAQP